MAPQKAFDESLVFCDGKFISEHKSRKVLILSKAADNGKQRAHKRKKAKAKEPSFLMMARKKFIFILFGNQRLIFQQLRGSSIHLHFLNLIVSF